MLARLVTLATVVLLHFCSPMPLLNKLAPEDASAVVHDIAYADGPRHRLDLYLPEPATRPPPVVVFFYGGGWETGDKASYRFVGAALAARGILAMVPDYRLHPAVHFPGFVQDGAEAVAWVHANAARFGGDPHRITLLGHSAGAHIAALLALDPSYLRATGLEPKRDLCGVIGLAGPYDFLPGSAAVNAVFGPAAAWDRAQPINLATRDAPAMLLLAGAKDHTVEPGNTLRLADRLRAVGAQVESEVYPGISHRAIIVAIARPFAFLAPLRADIARFVSTCHRNMDVIAASQHAAD